MSRDETLRRIRLGDLQRLVRHRHFRPGHSHLSDDDAGRADLYELLLAISLGQGDQRKMLNAIELLAPWMTADEKLPLIDNINRTPDYLRKITAPKMGERLNLQNWERERLAIRTIAPVDMTPEQLQEQRKAKKRARMQRRRRAEGRKPREAYIANSISQKKPWESEGISRAQWYRNQNKGHETGVCPIKLTNSKHTLVSLRKARGRKRTLATVGGGKEEGRTIRRRILANDLSPRLVSNG